jgi:hypothetical protein
VFSEDSSSLYHLSIQDMEKFWAGMSSLTERITVWPEPRDLLFAGSKLFLDVLIREAAEFLNVSYPISTPVTPSKSIIRKIIQEKVAATLKREYSSHGNHVFTRHTRNALDKFTTCIDDEREAYNKSTLFPLPVWYLTPYNPSLIYLGEIRVFLVNGVLFQSVVTTPKQDGPELDIIEPHLFNPLSKLR